ncbi:CesD/SycD/LcrH family type III secretion system chaperone [Yersinia frederiksenii]|nr:CesD/SycD/LcrH family type III secretion system chaperone [Yersinia frederiksenii]
MSHYSFNDMQAAFAKIDNELKGQRGIRPQRVSDHQQVTALEIQTRYAQGYQAWLADDYAAAMADFSWLTSCCPLEPRFHLALAAVMQMQQEFRLALEAYACALLLDAKDPEPLYQMAICLLALDKGADAREALQTAIEMSYFNTEYATTAKKSQSIVRQHLQQITNFM